MVENYAFRFNFMKKEILRPFKALKFIRCRKKVHKVNFFKKSVKLMIKFETSTRREHKFFENDNILMDIEDKNVSSVVHDNALRFINSYKNFLQPSQLLVKDTTFDDYETLPNVYNESLLSEELLYIDSFSYELMEPNFFSISLTTLPRCYFCFEDVSKTIQSMQLTTTVKTLERFRGSDVHITIQPEKGTYNIQNIQNSIDDYRLLRLRLFLSNSVPNHTGRVASKETACTPPSYYSVPEVIIHGKRNPGKKIVRLKRCVHSKTLATPNFQRLLMPKAYSILLAFADFYMESIIIKFVQKLITNRFLRYKNNISNPRSPFPQLNCDGDKTLIKNMNLETKTTQTNLTFIVKASGEGLDETVNKVDGKRSKENGLSGKPSNFNKNINNKSDTDKMQMIIKQRGLTVSKMIGNFSTARHRPLGFLRFVDRSRHSRSMMQIQSKMYNLLMQVKHIVNSELNRNRKGIPKQIQILRQLGIEIKKN